jgi:hypothetical protein
MEPNAGILDKKQEKKRGLREAPWHSKVGRQSRKCCDRKKRERASPRFCDREATTGKIRTNASSAAYLNDKRQERREQKIKIRA